MAGRFSSRKKEVDLESMVCQGRENAYEALQLYKSKINRQKQKQDYESAISIAVKGTRALLSHHYSKAGLELLSILLDLLDSSERQLDVDNRNIINEFEFLLLPVERLEFLQKCLKWSNKNDNRMIGDVLLHIKIGTCQWNLQNFPKAVFHFVAGEAPDNLWGKIADSFTPASPDRDRYYTLGIVHFIAMENLRDANALRRCYEKEVQSRNVTRESELVTFCAQLLLLCQRDAAPLFKELYVANKPVLATCDPAVASLLENQIAHIYFNIQPAPSMLNMLQGLFG